MSEVWPTRWKLSCPKHGTWAEVLGYGRWRRGRPGPWTKEHPAPEGLHRYPPLPETPAEMFGINFTEWLDTHEWIAEGPTRLADGTEDGVARSLTRPLPCFACYDLAQRIHFNHRGIPDRDYYRQVARAWGPLVDLYRSRPPDADGMKECVLCHHRYPILPLPGGRKRDSAYCSQSCRQLANNAIGIYEGDLSKRIAPARPSDTILRHVNERIDEK